MIRLNTNISAISHKFLPIEAWRVFSYIADDKIDGIEPMDPICASSVRY
jgi:hypothetical protein